MKTEQERIEYLLANPNLAKEPLGTTPNLRDYQSNCHGVSLWVKDKDNLLNGWGDLVKLVKGKPGFISSLAMQGFLERNKKVEEIEKPVLDELITLWDYEDYGRGPDEDDLVICHSGIWRGENTIFHLNGIYKKKENCGGKLENIKLNNLALPSEEDRTIIRYFKII